MNLKYESAIADVPASVLTAKLPELPVLKMESGTVIDPLNRAFITRFWNDPEIVDLKEAVVSVVHEMNTASLLRLGVYIKTGRYPDDQNSSQFESANYTNQTELDVEEFGVVCAAVEKAINISKLFAPENEDYEAAGLVDNVVETAHELLIRAIRLQEGELAAEEFAEYTYDDVCKKRYLQKQGVLKPDPIPLYQPALF